MSDGVDLHAIDRLLVKICRLHHGRAHALLEDLGLYRGQPPLMWALATDPGLSQTELAERLHVTPATVSKMVHRMEKAGVLETRADPADQRVSRVFLTQEGVALHARAGEVGGQLGAETLTDFDADELVQLEGFLERIHANLVAVHGDGACGAKGKPHPRHP